MVYGSVCSGIEAATVAWEPLGWRASFFSEIEAFPRAVLRHRFPHVPLHGDFTTIKGDEYEPIDVLVGGTPCQSFSIAGLRGGLDDDRGNLSLEFLRLADRTRARWVLWENVPGVLSSFEGRDFGAIVTGLVELGYGCAWRILDAQYWGVAQRRRRVFLVGCFGNWRGAAAVLFERASLQGHPAPSRQARESAAGTLGGSSQSGGFRTTDLDNNGAFIPVQANTLMSFGHGPNPLDETLVAFGGNRTSGPIDVTPALLAQPGSGFKCDFESETFITHSLRGEGFDASEDGTGRGTPLVPVAFGEHDASTQKAHAATVLRALRDAVGAEAFAEWRSGILDSLQSPEVLRAWLHGGGIRRTTSKARPRLDDGALARAESLPAGQLRDLWRNGPDGCSPQGRQLAQQLAAELGARLPILPPESTSRSEVRRLTPREAERLQGFPDDYTAIPWRGKPAAECPDGPRYKALGNSMAVPVVRWIGRRIAMVDAILKENGK